VTEDLHRAGFRVHLDVGEVSAERKDRIRWIEARLHSDLIRSARASGPSGDVLERHESVWNTAYVYPPVGHHDVGGRRLERGGRQRSDLSLEPDGALMNRRSGDGRAPTAERADGIGRLVRIAVEDADLVERNAERVGGKLGPRGLVSLAMRGRPGDDRDRPVEFQPGCGAILGKSRSLLDIGRDADALQSPLPSRGRLRATQPRVVRELDEPLQ